MASRTLSFDFAAYLIGALGAGILVFAASLFGILTRPEGLLAVLWPANAMLLAAFVRVPTMNSVLGWFAAFGGYMLADLMTGTDFNTAVWLTLANMIGVAVGLILIRRLGSEDREFRRPAAILFFCIIGAAAAVGSGLVGIAIAIFVYDSDPFLAFVFWSSTEFSNYVIILPFALTVPGWSVAARECQAVIGKVRQNPKLLSGALPAVSLILSLLVVSVVSGQGSAVFPLPALLWCALSYRLNVVALLIMLMSLWLMVALERDLLSFIPEDSDPYYGVIAIRLEVAMLALGPFTVASIERARSALVKRLDHAAKHDYLTGVMTRGALMPLGQLLVDRIVAQKGRLAVMVMDLDYFKKINDNYGHAVGDNVLVEVASVIRKNLRSRDILARLGGEEFAVIVPDIGLADAQALAQRIRKAVEAARVTGSEQSHIHTSLSIGLVCRELDRPVTLESLINDADKAMYWAKESGRNRVVDG
jgi:diguanylate cyclase (GGDEF)-like protein